jgi:hypothetical protein
MIQDTIILLHMHITHIGVSQVALNQRAQVVSFLVIALNQRVQLVSFLVILVLHQCNMRINLGDSFCLKHVETCRIKRCFRLVFTLFDTICLSVYDLSFLFG